jgi:mannan endo-1,4-beta-mannosidase
MVQGARRQSPGLHDDAPSAGSSLSSISSISRSNDNPSAASSTSSTLDSTNSSSALSSFAKTDGLLFNFGGETKYYAGTNAYWASFLTDDADIDLVMSHLSTLGLRVLRVWGFNDIAASTSGVWFQSFISGSDPVINTGSNGLERLDAVVAAAETYGISLIINFVNNWTDYGGMTAYATYYGVTKTAWYTDSNCQAQYQKYIQAVVSRYSNSTAVFAWELANEPRCNGCATSVLTEWATTTSAYIKSLDSNHLVTLGDEGFMNGGGDGSYPYTTGEGVDFAANLEIPDLDFGTLHLYPLSWDETDAWGNDWITNHATVCAAAGKPCILEEYGTTSSDFLTVESTWQSIALNLSGSGIAGDNFWQYGDDLSTGLTNDDGYAVYYNSSDATILIIDHVAAIDAQ